MASNSPPRANFENTRDAQPSVSEQTIMAFVEKVENLSLFQERIEKPAQLPQVWKAFKAEIDQQIESTAVALFLVDAKTHAFELDQWSPHDQERSCRREIDAQIDCGTFAWIVNRRQPAVIPSLVFGGSQTLVMLPLTTHARTLGVAVIVSPIAENTVTHERLKLLGILSKQCALVMENTQLYDRLQEEHESLRSAQSQIIQAEKFASLGRLTSGAFHELLNPLNIISGHLQIMMLDADVKPTWSDYLSLMKTEADRIALIVNSLLRFTARRQKDGRPIDVNRVVRRAVQDASDRQSNSDVQVNHISEDTLPALTVNEDDLNAVLAHLLDNAYEAMPRGGHLDIATHLFSADSVAIDTPEMLEIRIADNGCGVSEDNIHKVFDPFFTTKDIGQGMGLSLAVCYALVQSMGGTIGFDRRETGGTVFWVRLPLDNP